MKIKAIALGVITDWIGTILFAIPIAVISVFIHWSRGGKPDTFETFFQGNMPLMISSLFLGLATVVVGGGVTAHVAKQNRVWNAFIMGIVTLLIAIPFSPTMPHWYKVASFLLVVPCAILGGWFVETRQRG